jgi:hypothetical protein
MAGKKLIDIFYKQIVEIKRNIYHPNNIWLMVIYDRNQLTFNLLFAFILIASVILNVIYALNFVELHKKYLDVNASLAKVESNQNFNFIQASHNNVEFQLTPQGFYIVANDYGVFNGPSMQPSIFDGNTLIEKRYDGSSKLSAGQIIRYIREDGAAVVHRVRADYGDKVFVQGDSLKEGEIIEKGKITHIIVGILFT